MYVLTTELGWTVYNAHNEVVGWVRYGNVGNSEARKNIIEGRPYHAIPKAGMINVRYYGDLNSAVNALR